MSTQQSNPAEYFKVGDMITVTARLAQILAEEVDHLNTMKVNKIEALQKEKLFLINALEAHKKVIDKHPQVLDTIPSQDRSDLKDVVDVFEDMLEQNRRKLEVARAVNRTVVEAIRDTVRENASNRYYDADGTTGISSREVLSVTLNKTV